MGPNVLFDDSVVGSFQAVQRMVLKLRQEQEPYFWLNW